MLSEPTYLAARVVAPMIETHFARHHEAATAHNTSLLASPPSVHLVEVMIDAAFWASLRREEGHPPKISLALLEPEQATQPVVFSKRRLIPYNLLKLAPAVELPGIHLGVWHDEQGLYVWGTATGIPPLCLVIEVIEPGLLVVKHRRADGFGKFVNVAILRGDQLQLVDGESAAMDDCPALQAFLPGRSLPTTAGETDNVLGELATAMRAHGRGGLVLVVPPNSTQWQESIVKPITYPVLPAYMGIAEGRQQEQAKWKWREDIQRAIGIVGGFTAVDGATVITRDYHLLAFGVKVARAETSVPVDKMVITEPVVDSVARYLHPAQNGGTRHLAAAQFVYDQRDALALVASQDGYFTVFAWSTTLEMVHAHRIDVLLL
ncbi:putative sensor domain DACNV-containing protein [uncultured Hymenobacter sp.]|uniref:putative sensor domain DACNV-containing protein n=1 Tax=uncultured Hymenobacter sp. TaxID=170016 RepID=UPI0035CBE75A